MDKRDGIHLSETQRQFIVRVLQAVHRELLGQDATLMTDQGLGTTLTPANSWTAVYEDHLRALDLVAHLLGAEASQPLPGGGCDGFGDPQALRSRLQGELSQLRDEKSLRRYFEAWVKASRECEQKRAQDAAGQLAIALPDLTPQHEEDLARLVATAAVRS